MMFNMEVLIVYIVKLNIGKNIKKLASLEKNYYKVKMITKMMEFRLIFF